MNKYFIDIKKTWKTIKSLLFYRGKVQVEKTMNLTNTPCFIGY